MVTIKQSGILLLPSFTLSQYKVKISFFKILLNKKEYRQVCLIYFLQIKKEIFIKKEATRCLIFKMSKWRIEDKKNEQSLD